MYYYKKVCSECGKRKAITHFKIESKEVDKCRYCRTPKEKCPTCKVNERSKGARECRECAKKTRKKYASKLRENERKVQKVKIPKQCEQWPMCINFIACHDEKFKNEKPDCYYFPQSGSKIYMSAINPTKYI